MPGRDYPAVYYCCSSWLSGHDWGTESNARIASTSECGVWPNLLAYNPAPNYLVPHKIRKMARGVFVAVLSGFLDFALTWKYAVFGIARYQTSHMIFFVVSTPSTSSLKCSISLVLLLSAILFQCGLANAGIRPPVTHVEFWEQVCGRNHQCFHRRLEGPESYGCMQRMCGWESLVLLNVRVACVQESRDVLG